LARVVHPVLGGNSAEDQGDAMTQNNSKQEWEQETYDSLERMASGPSLILAALPSVTTEEPIPVSGSIVDAVQGDIDFDLGAWCPRLA